MHIKVKEGIKGTKWSEVSRMSSFTVTQKGSAFEQILSCGECLAKDQSRYQQSSSPCEVGGNILNFYQDRKLCFIAKGAELFLRFCSHLLCAKPGCFC